MGGFGQHVGCGGRYDQQVRLIRQGHVLHMVLKIPIKGIHHGAVVGQGIKGVGADELRGVPGHYHLHVIAALYQQGRQHGGFIAGDTAGHAENHCFFPIQKNSPSAAPTGLLL